MEWQAIVLAIQILLLAVGWLLFQKARGELSARAAEAPVILELKALEQSVKQLLTEMETSADLRFEQLETSCEEARFLIQSLKTQSAEAAMQREANQRSVSALPTPSSPSPSDTVIAGAAGEEVKANSSRRKKSREAQKEILVQELLDENEKESGRENGKQEEARPVRAFANEKKLPRDQVYQLADAGEPLPVIARTTRLSEGEVETLLGLRQLV